MKSKTRTFHISYIMANRGGLPCMATFCLEILEKSKKVRRMSANAVFETLEHCL